MNPRDLKYETPPAPWAARDWDWFTVAWLERRRAFRGGLAVGLFVGSTLTVLAAQLMGR